MADDSPDPFPLFKGATRVPTYLGVPVYALLVGCSLVGIIAMWCGLLWWLLLGPVFVMLRLITRHDDRAFSIWGLWFMTRLLNRNKAFWRGSSYATTDYRKPWRRR